MPPRTAAEKASADRSTAVEPSRDVIAVETASAVDEVRPPEPEVALVAEPEVALVAEPEVALVAEPEVASEAKSEVTAQPAPPAEAASGLIELIAPPAGLIDGSGDVAVADPPRPEPDEPAAVPDELAPAAALRLRGLTKLYGDTRAVDAIDLEVPVGGFYGLVGPNGAGKTTTLSLIAGLLRPDGGTIHVAGIDLARDPRAAKRQMGILPDRLRTFDRLTGRQLLYYYGTLRGLKSAVVENRISDLARAFDLEEALNRSVADYSAGMTKKVMLAGAMIHSPRLLVLDEPFESVDPVSSAVILDILRAYVDHGGTVILSSHGMELVERACSAVAILVGGKVLAEGSIDDVRAGGTLEQRFLDLAGGTSVVEGLEWLHSFSD